MFLTVLLGICINLYLLASLTSVAGIGMLTFALMVLFLIDLFIKNPKLKLNEFRIPGDILLGLFVFITLVSFFFNYENDIPARESFIDLRWILSIYVITWALKKYITDEKKLNIIAVFAIILSIYNIIQFFWGVDLKAGGMNPYQQGDVWRVRGFLNNPIRLANVFGAFAILIAPFALHQYSQKKNFLFLTVFGGCVLSLILSLTRGAWIAFLIAVPFVLFFYNRKLIVKFLVAITLLVPVLFYISPDFQARMNSLVEAKTLDTEGRVVIWKAHTKAFLDNFWIGAGAGTSGKTATKYATEQEVKNYPILSHAHNEVLDILVTRGIFGGLIFLLINLFYIYQGLKIYKAHDINLFHKCLALGASGSLLFIFISGLTEANIENSDTSNMMVLSLAIIVWLSKEHLKEVKD